MQNWKARNLHLGSKFTAGRDFLSGRQISAKNRFSVAVVELTMQRFGVSAINRDHRAHRGSDVIHHNGF